MNKNRQSGITLIALVVTIVVLLILAGVSINLVLGQNGLVARAKEARDKTTKAEQDDKNAMNDASDWIGKVIKEIDDNSKDDNKSLPYTSETTPYMPGNEFFKVKGTNLDNGLVIQDEDGNQYVWVEVPKKEEIYKTAKLNITEFSETEYVKIENDLNTYAIAYRKNNTDKYVKDDTFTSGWYSDENEYNKEKQRMLKSVYQNGGFWVARYEAGIENDRTLDKTSNPTDIPQSKEGLYPYINVTRTQAKVLAEKLQYDNGKKKYTGNLMFGIQWDLILTFMHNKGNVTDYSINTDSKAIGNYYNSEFTIDRGKYTTFEMEDQVPIIHWNNYTENIEGVVINSKKLSKTSIESLLDIVIFTTGSSEQNSCMNIYDIAGNVWEWTLETGTSDDENFCTTCRGGDCLSTGTDNPAASHYNGNTSGSSFDGPIGFRVTLY